MSRLHTPDQFKSRPNLIAAGAAGLLLAYILASRALDTGSWWQYLGTLILLVLSVRLMRRIFKKK